MIAEEREKLRQARIVIQRKFGMSITRLPSSHEVKQKMQRYIEAKHARNKFPTMEDVRKQFSPSSGWSVPQLKEWVIDMGFEIPKKRIHPKYKKDTML